MRYNCANIEVCQRGCTDEPFAAGQNHREGDLFFLSFTHIFHREFYVDDAAFLIGSIADVFDINADIRCETSGGEKAAKAGSKISQIAQRKIAESFAYAERTGIETVRLFVEALQHGILIKIVHSFLQLCNGILRRAGFYEQDIEHSQNREYANNEQRKERGAFCSSGSMYSFTGNVAGSACRGICESSTR